MDLKTEIKKRADFFNEQLEKHLKMDRPEMLYEAIRHLPLAGGKRLRPILALLSCESVNGDITRVIPLSLAVEIIHNFTLVHDDIMDKSRLRRNQPSVHVKYGEPIAILAGDLLFAKGFESLHDTTGDLAVFKKIEFGLIDCIREICEGQALDIEFGKTHNVSEEEYLEMILKKTAVIFQYSAEAGAVLGGGSKKQFNALNKYGKNLGLAFQIHDDYLDMNSNLETLGKDIGNDIRNGKKTIIAVHAINNAASSEKKVIDRIFGNSDASEDDIKEIHQVFDRLGSINYAKKKAAGFSKQAKEALQVLDESEAKKILLQLADYAISREK